MDRAEDSPRSGKEGGGGGVGFQVWARVGRKGSRSCLFALRDGRHGGEPTWGGSLGFPGVVRSYHHIRSCRGWAEWEDRGRKNISHDVHSSSMLDI